MLVKSWATASFLTNGGGRLEGSDRDLNHGEIVALSYVDAVSKLLSLRGWDPKAVSFKLENMDSEPDTEYLDEDP